MQVWAIIYDSAQFSEELFQNALEVLDADSVARVNRFYRREDACRTLIGRLLIRMLVHDRGILHDEVILGFTTANKPYIVKPVSDTPIAFNLTHDNEVIAMAVAPGSMLPPAYSIGVDVMKLHVPRKESFRSFVEGVGDALTTLEYSLVCGNNVSAEEGLRRFFWIWTTKEAYTKALGLGLGFDFKRVEYDVPQDVLMVDGREPKGWEFFKFTISKETDKYVGVAARFLGGDDPCKIAQLDSESLVVSQGVEFTQAMIDRIGKGNR